MKTSRPRIAIPMPHSSNREYGERAIPQYERAVELAGGVPVRIPLDRTPAEMTMLIEGCDGVLLPGSNADVDPAKFGASRSPRTAAADPRRDAVDALLLDDAYRQRKPVLGICYGLQSLNVYRTGSLIQHIPDFLPEETRAKVNHDAGKKVAIAHTVKIEPHSRLAEILSGDSRPRPSGRVEIGDAAAGSQDNRQGHGLSRAASVSARDGALAPEEKIVLPVNSSHHQSADTIGDGLRIVARCPDDGVIEALEGTSPDHLVLAVQWHPERSMEQDAASLAILRALVQAAEDRRSAVGSTSY
ncbi:MAG TPA: gamma-glutamyl-gamma-aminobutyrate hydrolase family protein [Candidatus Acidoferrales bacterium]|nr:gamma-glutamyl-gamma-aminobutyrate hydrolase family protein [Candidatus Acidoferrales bacterium]